MTPEQRAQLLSQYRDSPHTQQVSMQVRAGGETPDGEKVYSALVYDGKAKHDRHYTRFESESLGRALLVALSGHLPLLWAHNDKAWPLGRVIDGRITPDGVEADFILNDGHPEHVYVEKMFDGGHIRAFSIRATVSDARLDEDTQHDDIPVLVLITDEFLELSAVNIPSSKGALLRSVDNPDEVSAELLALLPDDEDEAEVEPEVTEPETQTRDREELAQQVAALAERIAELEAAIARAAAPVEEPVEVEEPEVEDVVEEPEPTVAAVERALERRRRRERLHRQLTA